MKILIWGTGKLCERYLSQGEIDNNDIIGYVQSTRTEQLFKGKTVYLPEEVSTLEYDYIFVLVARFTNEIRDIAFSNNIDIDRMVFYDTLSWIDGHSYTDDYYIKKVLNKELCNSEEEKIKQTFPKLYSMIENNRTFSDLSIATFANGMDLIDGDKVIYSSNFDKMTDYMDYFRFRTFEFVARDIKERKIEGSCAEVGVFRGDFSKYINKLFPEKTLFLFDTFEGFDANEIDKEISSGLTTEEARTAFNDTSIEFVKNVLPYPEKCIFRKGYFPETAEGLEKEKYAFVSIDVDLEDSIYAGLEYFYPRMSMGGVIFVHDYNNRFYFGVKKAIRRYEEHIGHSLWGLPIADQGGTLIIRKI